MQTSETYSAVALSSLTVIYPETLLFILPFPGDYPFSPPFHRLYPLSPPFPIALSSLPVIILGTIISPLGTIFFTAIFPTIIFSLRHFPGHYIPCHSFYKAQFSFFTSFHFTTLALSPPFVQALSTLSAISPSTILFLRQFPVTKGNYRSDWAPNKADGLQLVRWQVTKNVAEFLL